MFKCLCLICLDLEREFTLGDDPNEWVRPLELARLYQQRDWSHNSIMVILKEFHTMKHHNPCLTNYLFGFS